MKKIILTAAIVLGMVSANAQEIKYGAKAGLNMSSLKYNETNDDENMRFAYNVGGFVEAKFGKLAIQPELLYSAQGVSRKTEIKLNDNNYSETKATLALNYLNIPVMVKYYVADNFTVEAGPQLGFLMSAKTKGTTEGKLLGKSFDKDIESEDYKEGMKSTDFSFNFGAGFNVTEQISVSARYCLGLSDLVKNNDSDDNYIKNNVIQLSVGYSF